MAQENTINYKIIGDHELFISQQEKTINKIRQALATLVGFIHYTSLGMLGNFAAHLIVQLRVAKIHSITQDQVSWITSIYIVPMAVVCMLTGISMQKIAKRYLLIIASIIEVIGWLIQYFLVEATLSAILIGRFMNGVAMAIAAPIIPLYLAEVTNPKIRGMCISFVFMGISFGVMVANIVGATFSWKTYILISTSLAIINFILVCYLKESYVWFLKKNDICRAKESFYWYRGINNNAILEIGKYIGNHANNINNVNNINSIDKKINKKTTFCSEFLTNLKLLALPLFVTLTLMLTMHLSGFKVVLIYSISIMGDVLPKLNIYIATIIMDVIRIVASIIGCILIKKCKIRILVMISGSGTAVSTFLFCLFKQFSSNSDVILPIFGLIALISSTFFTCIGLGSLPWVVCGEIFPLKVKDIGCGICTFVYYVVFFLSIKYSPLLLESLGLIGEFLFFGCCTAVGTLVMYFTMPETRNKTLGEIEDSLKAV